ncbi:hypothetical protein AB6D87_21490, partial [Vibrio lentus]
VLAPRGVRVQVSPTAPLLNRTQLFSWVLFYLEYVNLLAKSPSILSYNLTFTAILLDNACSIS